MTALLCLSLLAPLCANADLLYYDDFEGGFNDTTKLPSGWAVASESLDPNDHYGLSVGHSSGSLTYPNLAASGGKWELDNTREVSLTIANKFTDTPLSAGQTLFFSFLLNVAVAPAGTAQSGIMRLGSSAGGNDVAAIGFSVAEDPSLYRLSVDGQHRGYSHGDSLKIADPFNVGETILIVGSYTYSGGSVSFWINPDPTDLGSLVPPDADYTDPGHNSRPIDQYEIGFTGTSQVPGSWFLDEFRIGTTWADVTPVPEPSAYALFLGCGAVGLAVARRRRVAKSETPVGE